MGYRPLTDSKWGIAPSPTPSGGNLPPRTPPITSGIGIV